MPHQKVSSADRWVRWLQSVAIRRHQPSAWRSPHADDRQRGQPVHPHGILPPDSHTAAGTTSPEYLIPDSGTPESSTSAGRIPAGLPIQGPARKPPASAGLWRLRDAGRRAARDRRQLVGRLHDLPRHPSALPADATRACHLPRIKPRQQQQQQWWPAGCAPRGILLRRGSTRRHHPWHAHDLQDNGQRQPAPMEKRRMN